MKMKKMVYFLNVILIKMKMKMLVIVLKFNKPVPIHVQEMEFVSLFQNMTIKLFQNVVFYLMIVLQSVFVLWDLQVLLVQWNLKSYKNKFNFVKVWLKIFKKWWVSKIQLQNLWYLGEEVYFQYWAMIIQV